MSIDEDKILGISPEEKKGIELAMKWRRERLKNSDFTILSNNCCGALIYRLLGLPYLSPTINVGISHWDFIFFCSDINYYLYSPLEVLPEEQRIKFNNATCPIGIIRGDDIRKDVRIMFPHEKTFEEAKEKWYRRAKRVNLDNVFLLMDTAILEDEKTLDAYHNLPYKNKCVFSSAEDKERWPEVFKFDYYTKEQYQYGYMFKFRWNDDKLLRVMDQFDFTNWLNNGTIKKG